MIYKIISGLFIAIIGLTIGVYIFSPDLYDSKNIFYDRFYSGQELLSRIEEREIKQLPKTIERFALYGPTENGIGISVDRDCRFGDPTICSKIYKLQYRDFKGDTYFVNISKLKENKSSKEVNDLLGKFSRSVDGNFYRIEQHEIAWVSTENKSLVIIQKALCSVVNNQPETCNYPTKIDKADIVVATFTGIFPVDEI